MVKRYIQYEKRYLNSEDIQAIFEYSLIIMILLMIFNLLIDGFNFNFFELTGIYVLLNCFIIMLFEFFYFIFRKPYIEEGRKNERR